MIKFINEQKKLFTLVVCVCVSSVFEIVASEEVFNGKGSLFFPFLFFASLLTLLVDWVKSLWLRWCIDSLFDLAEE